MPPARPARLIRLHVTPTFARIDGDLWPDVAIAADFGLGSLLNGPIAASLPGQTLVISHPALQSP